VFRKGGDIDLHEARVTISTPMTINVLKYAAVDRATFLIVCGKNSTLSDIIKI
jgi:hypothetical protein